MKRDSESHWRQGGTDLRLQEKPQDTRPPGNLPCLVMHRADLRGAFSPDSISPFLTGLSFFFSFGQPCWAEKGPVCLLHSVLINDSRNFKLLTHCSALQQAQVINTEQGSRCERSPGGRRSHEVVQQEGHGSERPGSFRFHSFSHSLTWLSTVPGVRRQGMGDGLRILSLHPLPGPGSEDSGLGKAACHLPQRTVKWGKPEKVLCRVIDS